MTISRRTKVLLTYFFRAIAIAGAIALLIIGIVSLQKLNAANVQIKEQNSQIKAQNVQLKKQNTEIKNQGKAVIESNNDQTLLMCTFINRGDLTATEEEAAELERICQERIERFQNRGEEAPAEATTGKSSDAGMKQSAQKPAQPSHGDNQPPTPLEPMSAIDRLGYVLKDTFGELPKALRNVLNLITT